jgi:hypothetical protein
MSFVRVEPELDTLKSLSMYEIQGAEVRFRSESDMKKIRVISQSLQVSRHHYRDDSIRVISE